MIAPIKRVTLASCVLAAAACTQVLGLEEAELAPPQSEDTPSAAGPLSVPLPGTACEEPPQPSCVTCLQGCVVDTCVADYKCRRELDTYAACLGSRCDADQESCALGVDDPDLFACLTDCAADCEGTRLVAPCELYCACMEEFCVEERDAVGDCMTTCEALPDDVRDCRRDHCEWGRGMGNHCKHASDRIPICMPFDDAAALCGAGKERFWACDRDSECCSGDCGDGACR